MARRPKWIRDLRAGGGNVHPGSGVSVWPSGRVNATIYRSAGQYPKFRANGRTWLVHRVVAECFIPNPDNKPYVNHKDGDKDNPAADNLEWVTRSENSIHAYGAGLKIYTPPRRFTRREIMSIRRSEKDFDVLAKKYGVSRSVIYNIYYLKTHKKIK
jgi:hypothetical protein